MRIRLRDENRERGERSGRIKWKRRKTRKRTGNGEVGWRSEGRGEEGDRESGRW